MQEEDSLKKQHEAKRKVTIQAQVTQQTCNTLTASLGQWLLEIHVYLINKKVWYVKYRTVKLNY